MLSKIDIVKMHGWRCVTPLMTFFLRLGCNGPSLDAGSSNLYDNNYYQNGQVSDFDTVVITTIQLRKLLS